MQPDTIIPDPSNPQAWDRYSYVTNRPINFSDPSGHHCFPEEDCKLFPKIPIIKPSENCTGDCYDAYLAYVEVVYLLGRRPTVEELLYMTADTEYSAYIDFNSGVRPFGLEGLARNYYEACYDHDGIIGCQGDELYLFLSGYQPWMGNAGQPANEPTTPLSRAQHLLNTQKNIKAWLWSDMSKIADFSYAQKQKWTQGMWRGQPWQWFGPFDPDRTCNKYVTPTVTVDFGGGQVFWMLTADQTELYQKYC